MDYSGVRIVIPHRGLRDGKSRLAGVLTPDDRAALNALMLDRVARAARAVVTDVVLISPDPSLAGLAAELGLRFRHQSGRSGLNPALEEATAHAISAGVTTLAVISADLPHVTSADVAALIRMAHTDIEPLVAIAPDRAGSGTNALVMRPPGAIPFRFGVQSCASHARECAELGFTMVTVRRAALAQDIDRPADLAAWSTTRSRRVDHQSVHPQLQSSV